MSGEQILMEYFEDTASDMYPPSNLVTDEFEEMTFEEEDDFGNGEAFFDPDTVEIPSDPLESSVPGDTVESEFDEIIFSEDGEQVELEPQINDDDYLPGSSVAIEREEELPPRETNWADDRDTSKFMTYIREAYPSGIPKHDGKTISGCEKAIAYLNKLAREISEAVRNDDNGSLNENIEEIEGVRVKIMSDVMKLQARITHLKSKIKDQHKKKADLDDTVKTAVGLVKEAGTPTIQMVITPFERAITGILVNSVISAGHPFEDVFEFLKSKFKLDTREELAMLQLVMDMGFPIFKDRGTIGGEGKDGKTDGVDFIKNYFA